jgi:ubiquinone/menaquinone biosynthesis C-methylase UbiE
MPSSDYQAKSAYQGGIASRYEADRMQEPLWAIEQAFVGSLIEKLPRGAKVLDVPAGTGRFIGMFQARRLRISAMDISTDMLNALKERHPECGEELCILEGDAEKLPFADQSIDWILSWRFFHLIPLPVIDRVLGEFRRVCRGEMVIQVLPVRLHGLALWVPAWVKALVRPVRRRFQGAPATPWSHIPSYIHAERELRRLFARHRLAVISAETLAEYQGLPVRVYTLRVQH